MSDRNGHEAAITDAEVAVVVDVLHSHLCSHAAARFCATALDPQQQRALDHAGIAVCLSVARLSIQLNTAFEVQRL